MHTAIAEYVQEVREACCAGLSLPARVRRIREAAQRHVAKPLDLGPEARYLPPTGYGRNLLHRDAEHGFVVIAMVWPPNTVGSPHDHSTWGVVAVSEGKVRIANYEREDDGSDAARARLRETLSVEGEPGDTATVLPPHEDIHSVCNPFDGPALSIHTYGRDIKRCRVFDSKTGAIEQVDLSYHKGSGA